VALRSGRVLLGWFIYRDKEVVGVFVRFSCAASLGLNEPSDEPALSTPAQLRQVPLH
jgi:hypothetical protein